MNIRLFRVRFQETYGDHLGDYLDEVVTQSELVVLLESYAEKWFPQGHTLTQDPDSPNSWTLIENTNEERKVFFFVEPVG